MAKSEASSTFKSACPADTARLAAIFARRLTGGTAIFLEGPIGAGKTFFVRELAAALGAKRLPVSASFNLMRSYSGRLKLYHFDLFRAGEADMENIGLEEYLGREDGITAVEWPGEAGRLYSGMNPLRLEFGLAGGDRRVIRAAGCADSLKILKSIEGEWLKN